MKKFIAALAIVATALTAAPSISSAQEVVIGAGEGAPSFSTYFQNFNRTLSADTCYVLTGLYIVDSTYTLTIEPGTIVKGDTGSALLIARGAKIEAAGEPFNPIVFTSRQPAGARAAGDWGGVLIAGNGVINQGTATLEGGIFPSGVSEYGGADDTDDSGTITYARIEFAGFQFAPGDETNGLTMGGVGSTTEIHHVQVSYGFDDSFEWFGGNSDHTHLICMAGSDDQLDSDFGYRGNIQWVFGIQDPNQFDLASGGTRSIETDNDGSNFNNVPRTRQVISNATMIGARRTTATTIPFGAPFDVTARVREGSATSVFNSIFAGHPQGLSFRDQVPASLEWRNVAIQSFATEGAAGCLTANPSIHDESGWPGTEACHADWLNTTMSGNWDNNGSPFDIDAMGFNDLSDLNFPQPGLTMGSLLAGRPSDYTATSLAGFDNVSYIGAFAVGELLQESWVRTFAHFDPVNADYSCPGGNAPTAVGTATQTKLSQNYPNPFNPTTTIEFTVPARGKVTLQVFNAKGQLVSTLVDGILGAGNYTEVFSPTELSSGIYFYQLVGEGFSETRKMVLLK